MLESTIFKKLNPKSQEDFLTMNYEPKLYAIEQGADYQIMPSILALKRIAREDLRVADYQIMPLVAEGEWPAKTSFYMLKEPREVIPSVSSNFVPTRACIISIGPIKQFSLHDVRSEVMPSISKEVLGFCEKYSLKEYLLKVIDIVRRCIPNIERMQIRVEQDPEVEEEEWISIEIDVKSEVEIFLSSYDRYISQLIAQIPWPERSRFRLSYNIL